MFYRETMEAAESIVLGLQTHCPVCIWEGPVTVKTTCPMIAPILASSPTFSLEFKMPSFNLLIIRLAVWVTQWTNGAFPRLKVK